MDWRKATVSRRRVRDLAKALGVPPLMAHLLTRLDLADPEEANAFLHPRLRQLDDPFRITHLREAVRRLRAAMAKNERISIIGDYDVDGVTSTALLVHTLNRFGIFPHYTVPHRVREGYGLSRAVIDRTLESGSPDLVIAVDCGTNSMEELDYLASRGVDVIIIDHHRSTCDRPVPAILINPHVNDEEDRPWRDLCSVGLVFKLAHGLVKDLRNEGDPTAYKTNLKDYLDLVAMGTVADVVPLTGENRILTRAGLKALRSTQRSGLHALFHVSGIGLGTPITGSDISFKLGPRINASGRLADAELSVRMLLGKKIEDCLEIAGQLDRMNRERQNIQQKMVREADQYIEGGLPNVGGHVLYNPDWHHGVVGIVAGRLARKHNVPAIVLGKEGPLAKGSGRSVEGVNLVEVLQQCSGLLESWGGHPMATGVSLPIQNLPAFQAAFDRAVKRALEGNSCEPELEIAAYVGVDDITEDLMTMVDRLNPFGEGNPVPVFGIKRVRLARLPEVFGANHFRFSLITRHGTTLNGVAWKKADRLPPADCPIDLAVKLAWNSFNGRRFIQMELVDWRRKDYWPSGTGATS